MEKKLDVAIIGGGPIGAYVAEKISSKEFNVSIFEKNGKIGEPINCAGLVTKRVIDLCKLNKKNIIQNEIKGAIINSPSNNCIRIGGDRLHALVINRKNFDLALIEKAIKKGAELNLNKKFISANKKSENIELFFSKNERHNCKLLIGADGPYSMVRRNFLFEEPKEFLFGMGAEIENINLNPNFVEIFIGNNIAPGFFAWIIPINNEGTKARIGLCIKQKCKNSINYYFNNYVTKIKSLTQNKIKISNIMGGIIPIGPLNRFYKPHVMLVGDAAAQVKPTSGGGLYPGLMCAEYCSKIAIESIKKNNFDENQLKKYQKLYQKNISSELDKGMRFRNIFLRLDDNILDMYIKKFQKNTIIETISKYGDIDYPSKLVPKLIKKSPSLLKIVANLIK